MRPAPLPRAVLAGLLLVAVGAGVAAPRWPALGAILFGVLLAAGVARWRSLAALRRAIEPGLSCELDRLETLASEGDVFGRHVACVVLIHHGGFDRVFDDFREDDPVLFAELDDARHIVRKSWGTLRAQAYDQAARHADVDAVPALHRSLVASIRLLGIVVSYAAMVEEREPPDNGPIMFAAALGRTLQTWPALKWPLQLAAAREALARGDAEAGAAYLDGMPGWSDGSPLERVRQRLTTQLESAGADEAKLRGESDAG